MVFCLFLFIEAESHYTGLAVLELCVEQPVFELTEIFLGLPPKGCN